MRTMFLQVTSVAKLKISKFSGEISKLTYKLRFINLPAAPLLLVLQKLCFARFEINESYFNFVAASITELKEQEAREVEVRQTKLRCLLRLPSPNGSGLLVTAS